MRIPYDRLLYIISFLAPLVLFLPVHPVVQGLIYQKIPAMYISMVLLGCLLTALILALPALKFKLDLEILFLLLALVLYVAIFSVSSIRDYSYEINTYKTSLFTLLITLPLAILMAYFSSLKPKAAFLSLLILSFFVLLPVLFFIVSGESHSSGFLGASDIAGKTNYQATSIYIGMFFILVIQLFKNKYILFFINILAIFVLAVVGTRSALLAYILTYVFIYFISNKSLYKSLLYLVGFSVLFAIYLSLDVYKPVAFYRLTVLFDGSDESGRIFLFSKAIEMWLSSFNTFFFGGGLGSYPVYIGAVGKGWYPHNFILETLAEGGLLAFLFLVYILFKYLKELVKGLEKERVNYYGFISFYFLMVYQFISGISNLWIPMFFMFLYMFTIKLEKINER